jgi:hypothetical protein
VIKNFGDAKKVLGTRITRDRKKCKLTFSQGEYIEKVLERFKMQNEKPFSTHFSQPFQINKGNVSQDT